MVFGFFRSNVFRVLGGSCRFCFICFWKLIILFFKGRGFKLLRISLEGRGGDVGSFFREYVKEFGGYVENGYNYDYFYL